MKQAALFFGFISENEIDRRAVSGALLRAQPIWEDTMRISSLAAAAKIGIGVMFLLALVPGIKGSGHEAHDANRF